MSRFSITLNLILLCYLAACSGGGPPGDGGPYWWRNQHGRYKLKSARVTSRCGYNGNGNGAPATLTIGDLNGNGDVEILDKRLTAVWKFLLFPDRAAIVCYGLRAGADRWEWEN